MGSLGVVLGVFIMFSLAVSWVAGDKEKARLEDTVKETKTVQAQLKQEVNISKVQAAKDADQLRDLEDKLNAEIDEKKRLERALALEERKKRIKEMEGNNIGVEGGGNAGENENSGNTAGAAPEEAPEKSEKSEQQDVDLSKESEKIKAEVEAKAKQEISELEAKLTAVEDAKKKLEAEEQLKIEEEARKRAEAAWAQAEQARAQAQEMSAKSVELEAKLNEAEESLKKQNAAREEIAKKLAEGEEAKKALEARLNATGEASAKAQASDAVAKDLIAKNAELEARLKEAGLLSLQGKAANYVAEKLIERNAELESQLKGAALALSQSEAARQQAQAAGTRNDKDGSNSNVKGAGVALASDQNSTTILEKLNEKNSELESRIRQTEAAQAEAEAARFMAQELASKNKNLESRLKEEKLKNAQHAKNEAGPAAVENSPVIEGLKAERGKTESGLLQEEAMRRSLEARLEEAEAQKASGDETIKKLAGDKFKQKENEKVASLNVKEGAVMSSGVLGEANAKEFAGNGGKAYDIYVVKNGDNLWKIAARKEVYDNGRLWPIIFMDNALRLMLQGPNMIEPNMTLLIRKDISQKEIEDALVRSNLYEPAGNLQKANGSSD